jgi:hypothetical protein
VNQAHNRIVTAKTALETPDAAPPPGGCWCCGTIDDPAQMVHLGNHPEVALCRGCARWVAKQAWEIDDRSKNGLLVSARDRFRAARRGVINRGWHRNPVLGRPLRWIGRHLP